MRKLTTILVPLIILAVALVAVACDGESATPTPAASPTPVPTAEPTAVPTVAPTPAVTTPAAPTPTMPPASSMPCRFRGTIQLNGANVADGTIVTAIIAGDEYTTMTPAEGYGPSTYAIKIIPPEGTSYTAGAVVTFKIGDYTAVQTGSWVIGGNVELNLTASSI